MPSLRKEEVSNFMKFIVEKTKDVKYPMNIRGLSREFRTETGSKLTEGGIRLRIINYREKISQMNEFDITTKVKMMFALSASVDDGFLIKLKKHAHVEVDEHGRITKYKSNDGSLELEGHHGWSTKKKTIGENRKNERVLNDPSRLKENDSSEEESDEDGECLSKRKSNKSVTSSSTGRKEEIAETRGRKRARISYSSKESENDAELIPGQNDLMNPRNFDHHGDDVVFDQPNNDQICLLVKRKPGRIIENVPEVKQEQREEDQHDQSKEEQEPPEVNIIQLEQEPMNLADTEPEKESSPSVKDLLVAFRGPLAAIQSRLIQDLLTNIEQMIRRLGNKLYLKKKVNVPFNSCLYVLTENAVPECPPGEASISLRDVLIGLRAYTSYIRHSSMDSFHEELDSLIQELTTQDKIVPVEIVHRAVAAALVIMAP